MLNIERLYGKKISDQPVEIVERKGRGHPDTICDRMAEQLGLELCRFYLDKFGKIFHHNVDKCVLAGGSSKPIFGGGKIIKPIYVLLVGRATDQVGKVKVPLKDLVKKSVTRAIKHSLRFADLEKNFKIDFKIRSGSADLVDVFARTEDMPRANDTSMGVGFAPLTETEKLVFDLENRLNAKETKDRYPEIGEDIKIMGVRKGEEIHLTVGIAYISRFISSLEKYIEAIERAKKLISSWAQEVTSKKVIVELNPADDLKKGSVYITITGTSAECGDDGQVGRGNRANGLITPYRPMSLEATAGKNPVSHVGKIYNILAREIAEELIKLPGIEEAYCYLVSKIAQPINKPQIVDIKVRSELDEKELKEKVQSVALSKLEQVGEIWRDILKEKFILF